MKIDFGTVLKDLDDNDIKTDSGKELTLRFCAANALITPDAKEQSADKKVLAYKLAHRIAHSDGPLEITPEEATLIKNRIATVYPSALVIGRATEILNG